MPTFHREHKWQHWKGSPADLANAASLAVTTLREWTDTEPDVDVAITERGGSSRRGLTLQDLHTIVHDTDLRSIENIRVNVGRPFSAPRVLLGASRSVQPAAVVEVDGNHATQTDGLYLQVVALMDLGRRVPAWLDPYLKATFILVVMLIIPGASNYMFGGLVKQHSDTPVAFLAWLGGTLGVTLAALMACLYLMPNLELRPSGQPTKLRRYMKLTVAVMGTIAVGVAIDAIARWLHGR